MVHCRSMGGVEDVTLHNDPTQPPPESVRYVYTPRLPAR